MSIEHFSKLAGDCLSTSGSPILCLRLESARERLAIPYASLTAVRLSTDETILTILFVAHRVTIKGRKLDEAHCAIAAGSAAALAVGRRSFRSSLQSSNSSHPIEAAETIAITDIRIESVEAAP